MSRWPKTAEAYNQAWLERVLTKTAIDADGCRIWQGCIHPSRGYGNTSYRGKNGAVHRYMWQVVHGVTLGRWEFVCHKCDVPLCCNIDHLWVGTPKENQQDMSRKGRAGLQSATHCKQGHEFTPENTYRAPSTGRRGCRACQRERQRREWHFGNRREYQKQRRRTQREERT